MERQSSTNCSFPSMMQTCYGNGHQAGSFVINLVMISFTLPVLITFSSKSLLQAHAYAPQLRSLCKMLFFSAILTFSGIFLLHLQAPTYAPQLGSLCKMLFFYSAVHQLVFCFRSTLPFGT